jgi:hypothetical protein
MARTTDYVDGMNYLKAKQIPTADWQDALDDLTRHIKPKPTNVDLVRMVNDDPKAPSGVYLAAFQALVAFERNRSQPKGTVAGGSRLPELRRTAEEATKEHANDIGCLLDMIGQAVNRMAAEPTWPVAGTLATSRQSLIDILVHVGDLDESAIKDTLDEMRADAHAAEISKIPTDGGEEYA